MSDQRYNLLFFNGNKNISPLLSIHGVLNENGGFLNAVLVVLSYHAFTWTINFQFTLINLHFATCVALVVMLAAYLQHVGLHF